MWKKLADFPSFPGVERFFCWSAVPDSAPWSPSGSAAGGLFMTGSRMWMMASVGLCVSSRTDAVPTWVSLIIPCISERPGRPPPDPSTPPMLAAPNGPTAVTPPPNRLIKDGGETLVLFIQKYPRMVFLYGGL